MIPAEAIEAAAQALFTDDAREDDELNWTDYYFEYRRRARLALEAASPHIAEEAWEEGSRMGYRQRAKEYDTKGRYADVTIEPNPYRSKA